MSYLVVWDGAIHQAFDTLDEATALVARHPGARVIGDEWLTVGRAKERVDQARRALDEVAMMVDPQRFSGCGRHWTSWKRCSTRPRADWAWAAASSGARTSS
jgi:hypothetical protein